MELSLQLYLRDIEIDFTSEPLSNQVVGNPAMPVSIINPEEEGKVQQIESVLAEKSSQLKNLTLVDCNITGLSTILNTLGAANLEQLIIIHNEDSEEPTDEYGVPYIYNELI